MIAHFRILRWLRMEHEKFHLPYTRRKFPDCRLCRIVWYASRLAAGLPEGARNAPPVKNLGCANDAAPPEIPRKP
jgi:hypothetical protein